MFIYPTTIPRQSPDSVPPLPRQSADGPLPPPHPHWAAESRSGRIAAAREAGPGQRGGRRLGSTARPTLAQWRLRRLRRLAMSRERPAVTQSCTLHRAAGRGGRRGAADAPRSMRQLSGGCHGPAACCSDRPAPIRGPGRRRAAPGAGRVTSRDRVLVTAGRCQHGHCAVIGNCCGMTGAMAMIETGERLLAMLHLALVCCWRHFIQVMGVMQHPRM